VALTHGLSIENINEKCYNNMISRMDCSKIWGVIKMCGGGGHSKGLFGVPFPFSFST